MMFRIRFHFWIFCFFFLWNFDSVLWYPLFFKAVSYSEFVSLKISSLHEFLFNLLLTDIGKSLMTCGWWLVDVLRNYWNVPFVRLKVTSETSTLLRFALISVLKSTSLKIFINFFLIWSIFFLLTVRIITNITDILCTLKRILRVIIENLRA